MTSCGSYLECPAIPRAVVVSQKAQCIQMAPPGSTFTGTGGHGQPVVDYPLKHRNRS